MVARSRAFDDELYGRLAGFAGSRRRLARHYVRHGSAAGLPPAAWFDPEWFREQAGLSRDREPFTAYLRDADLRVLPTHPLVPAGSAADPGGLRDAALAWRERLSAGRTTVPRPTASATSAGTPAATVVVVAHGRWQPTKSLLDGIVVVPGGVQVVVVDLGSTPASAAVLDSFATSEETAVEADVEVEVHHLSPAHTVVEATNLALGRARGSVVVLATHLAQVRPGWLEGLLDALHDPEVCGAQGVVLRPTGAVQTAGLAFPATGAAPYDLLRGWPRDDTPALGGAPLTAVSTTSATFRLGDLLEAGGLDPGLDYSLSGLDLCHRIQRRRGGSFATVPAAVAVCRRSPQPSPDAEPADPWRALVDRWGGSPEPDEAALWRRVGFEVVGHDPAPVLTRSREVQIAGSPALAPGAAPLRWAIKIASFAAEAESWGDTHFARHLADALRSLGQHVTIDYRREFDRESADHDDVVVVIRGLAPYRPRPHQVNLLWVISHPDLVGRDEALGYDQVFAASRAWSEARSNDWGLPVRPLLQATDPALFHPDRAVPDTGEPLLFVGTSHGRMRPMVAAALAADLPLTVYGGRWRGLIPEEHLRGELLENADLGAAYRSAGVVLNDHWPDMKREGFVSNRLFDAAGSAARVVTDRVPGLEGLFGRGVQVAETAQDLAALVRRVDLDTVFGDDAERCRDAARVHRDHSFTARARVLLEAALLSGRRER